LITPATAAQRLQLITRTIVRVTDRCVTVTGRTNCGVIATSSIDNVGNWNYTAEIQNNCTGLDRGAARKKIPGSQPGEFENCSC